MNQLKGLGIKRPKRTGGQAAAGRRGETGMEIPPRTLPGRVQGDQLLTCRDSSIDSPP